MRIMIIGSTNLYDKMLEHARGLRLLGHQVNLPYLDHHDLDELEICMKNIELIKQADEVHLYWNQRTLGAILDVGAVMALGKPLKIEYMEEKTLRGVFEKYSSLEIPDR